MSVRIESDFEFASRNHGEPVKIQNIAEAQGMSDRFLEAILLDINNGVALEFSHYKIRI